jgi:aminotransferase EvaB
MINLFNYQRALPDLEDDLVFAFKKVLHSGSLIQGPETAAFEKEFAAWCGAPYCIAVTSGTAALYLALKAADAGPGKEVITVSNTCPPTISAILMTGAIPVFVDVEPETLMMDISAIPELINKNTVAILPVHLWGNSVDLGDLTSIAETYSIPIIEDCAQAVGTLYQDVQVGNFGSMGCFSFYPTKNLGAYGDAGAIITHDSSLEKKLKMLRMYGYENESISVIQGSNARISEMQAAFLRIRLKSLDADLSRRRNNALLYNSKLSVELIQSTSPNTRHSYHQYVIRTPKIAELKELLNIEKIAWSIHYPTPTHQMPAFKAFTKKLPVTEAASSEIISIPVHEHLTQKELKKIGDILETIEL